MPPCLDGIKAIGSRATLGETILWDKEMSNLLKSICRKPRQLDYIQGNGLWPVSHLHSVPVSIVQMKETKLTQSQSEVVCVFWCVSLLNRLTWNSQLPYLWLPLVENGKVEKVRLIGMQQPWSLFAAALPALQRLVASTDGSVYPRNTDWLWESWCSNRVRFWTPRAIDNAVFLSV